MLHNRRGHCRWLLPLTTGVSIVLLPTVEANSQTIITIPPNPAPLVDSGTYVINDAPGGAGTGGSISVRPNSDGPWNITNNVNGLTAHISNGSSGRSKGLIEFTNNGVMSSSGGQALQFDPAGDVILNNNGTINSTSPWGSYAIWLRPDTGASTAVINNTGRVHAASGWAIMTRSVSDTDSTPYASVVLNNLAGGTIGSDVGSAALLSAGQVTVNNAGDITGSLSLGCSLGATSCTESTLNWTGGTISGDINMYGDRIAVNISSSQYDGTNRITASSSASTASLNITNVNAIGSADKWVNFDDITLTNSGVVVSDSGQRGLPTSPSILVRDTLSLRNGSSLAFAAPSAWIATPTAIDASSSMGLTPDARRAVGQLEFGSRLQLWGSIDISGAPASGQDQIIFHDHFLSHGGTLKIDSWLTGDESHSWADQVLFRGSGQARGVTNLVVTDLNHDEKTGLEKVLVVTNERTGTQPSLPAGVPDPGSDLDFKLSRRLVSGGYEYLLQREGNQWYLINYLIPSGPPGQPDNPIPILRVEAGALAANAKGALEMFSHSRRDRMDGTRFVDRDGRQYWLRLDGHREKIRSDRDQIETTFERYSLLGGADLYHGSTNGQDSFVIGAMVGYGKQHGRADSRLIESHAYGDINGRSIGVYATWAQNGLDKPGFHVDSWLMHGRYNATLHGEDFGNANYKMNTTTFSIEGAYQSTAVSRDSYRGWLEFQGQLMMGNFDMGSFKESAGSNVSATGHHTTARMGIRGTLESLDTRHQGYLQFDIIDTLRAPQISLDSYNIEKNDKTVYRIGAGYDYKVSPKTVLSGHIGYAKGAKRNSQTSAHIGIRHSF